MATDRNARVKHDHRWQRLNDWQLFCECGEVKDVSAPPPVHALSGGHCRVCCHHYHCWCGEHHLYHPTYVPYVPYWTTIGPSPTVRWGTYSVSDGTSVTLTSNTNPNLTAYNP